MSRLGEDQVLGADGAPVNSSLNTPESWVARAAKPATQRIAVIAASAPARMFDGIDTLSVW